MASRTQISANVKRNNKKALKASERVSRRVATSNPYTRTALMIFKISILVFFGFLVLFPFYYMISMSLMSWDEMNSGNIPLTPDDPSLGNYISAFNNGFWQSFFFTTFVVCVNIILKLFVCILLGYAFGNYNFRGKNVIWWILMLSLAIPEVALLSGQYGVTVELGMTSGPLLAIGLCAPFVASVFTGYMFRIAFEGIPSSVKEAAMIDGVSGPGYFFRIALPMISSTIWTVVILTVFASWNSYMWPSILMVDSSIDTIPLWLFNVGRDTDGSGVIHNEWQMAGTVLATLPTVIFYFIFKNKINNVVAGGANKG